MLTDIAPRLQPHRVSSALIARSAPVERAERLGAVLAAELVAADHDLSGLTTTDLVTLARAAAHAGRLALFAAGHRYCERCGDALNSASRARWLCRPCDLEMLTALALARDPEWPDIER